LIAADSKIELLIVDDDPLIADALGFFLGREYAVSTASTRAEAVSLLRGGRHSPALALIDLGLPPTPHRPDEGFALIADILAHAPGTRIVVLSGQSDELNARAGAGRHRIRRQAGGSGIPPPVNSPGVVF
jgi:two-component system nitrogen regulation response regulator GlnG